MTCLHLPHIHGSLHMVNIYMRRYMLQTIVATYPLLGSMCRAMTFCFKSRTFSSPKFWIEIIFPFFFSDKVPTLPLQSWRLECKMFEGEKVADPIPSLFGKDHAASLAAIYSIYKRAFAVYQKMVRALQSVISLNIFIADYLCLFTYIFCSLALLSSIYIYCRPALFNYLYLWQPSSV